ncbi:hypothetical protein TH63_08110 [Rufibacter radiotolerans]|uniref:MobA-like NTP transferase domain-containing protein n=1 Tax=Rufibacter radiotolerans TaxID=1379910 RepID=A0A0H4W5E3_9BACT|nr:nucleotidyltransferase family protein [Rufibacter radiotolerans]AKQ45621.1 hypothetical protein TH63_08110 [Rufibacter radiotolerans]
MTGIILLAAGGSSRLGKPKQTLVYQGQTLLQRAVETAIASGFSPVVVVLGAQADKLKTDVETLPVTIALNADWQDGMGGSIITGLKTLLKLAPQTESVIVLLCDQPFVDASLLQDLALQQAETGKGIVACGYGQTVGTPALFHKQFFPQLFTLSGQQGAKKLFTQFKEDLEVLPFSKGEIDIDTPEEYDQLLSRL